MGAIHDGHVALVTAGRKAAKRVVVGIYVNPTQFAVDEDFGNYPRNLHADQQALEAAGGVDAIYAPMVMYRDQHATNIVPSGVALPMEGESRLHFFTGVATISLNYSSMSRPIMRFLAKKISSNLPFCAKWW